MNETKEGFLELLGSGLYLAGTIFTGLGLYRMFGKDMPDTELATAYFSLTFITVIFATLLFIYLKLHEINENLKLDI